MSPCLRNLLVLCLPGIELLPYQTWSRDIVVPFGISSQLHGSKYARATEDIIFLLIIYVFSAGLTESCAASFIQVPNVISMHGTVGPPLPNIEVRLVSVPELNYHADSADSSRGEICIRGSTLFSGYYKRQDLTDEVLVDGWFSTGNVFSLIDVFFLNNLDLAFSLRECLFVSLELFILTLWNCCIWSTF